MPVFYGSIPGQFKLAIDRMFAFADIHIHLNKDNVNNYGSKLEDTRKIFLITIHGNSIPSVLECLERPFCYLAVEINGIYTGMYASPKLDFVSVYNNKGVIEELLDKGKDF